MRTYSTSVRWISQWIASVQRWTTITQRRTGGVSSARSFGAAQRRVLSGFGAWSAKTGLKKTVWWPTEWISSASTARTEGLTFFYTVSFCPKQRFILPRRLGKNETFGAFLISFLNKLLNSGNMAIFMLHIPCTQKKVSVLTFYGIEWNFKKNFTIHIFVAFCPALSNIKTVRAYSPFKKRFRCWKKLL